MFDSIVGMGVWMDNLKTKGEARRAADFIKCFKRAQTTPTDYKSLKKKKKASTRWRLDLAAPASASGHQGAAVSLP